ncbi:MAG TPA: hypothetical protein PLZ45_14970, partial [Ferruginibacter sp.]|nr:hypothetical protein [Ferruginibacter sp.]
GSPQGDALSVYFTLEQLKNLIWRMEKTACISGCDSATELAIRLYFIKYPKNMGTAEVPECLRGLSPDCSNKHSLAMVPAYRRGSEFYDFTINALNPYCFKTPVIYDNPTMAATAALISTPGTGDNHGGIGPPPGVGTYPTNPE